MQIFLRVGKLLALLFWGLVLANLLSPLAQPFAPLLNTCAGLVLLVHVVELFFYRVRVRQHTPLWWHYLAVMLFGVFHLRSLSQPVSQEAEHA